MYINGCFELAAYIICMSTHPHCRDPHRGNRLFSSAHHTRQVPEPTNTTLQPQGPMRNDYQASLPSIHQGSFLPQEALIDELIKGPHVLDAEEHEHAPSSAFNGRRLPDPIDGGKHQDELCVDQGQQGDLEKEADWQNEQPVDNEGEANDGQVLGHLYGYCRRAISSDSQFIDHLFRIRLQQAEDTIYELPLNDLFSLQAQIKLRDDSQTKSSLIFLIKAYELSRVSQMASFLKMIQWLKSGIWSECVSFLQMLLIVMMLYLYSSFLPACPSSSNSTTSTDSAASGDTSAPLTAHSSEYCQNGLFLQVLTILNRFGFELGICLLFLIACGVILRLCLIWTLKRKIKKL